MNDGPFTYLDRKLLASSLGVSRELLTGVEPYSTARELMCRFKATKDEIQPSLDAFYKAMSAFIPKIELWNGTGFFIMYVRRRPVVMIYGEGNYGYAERMVTGPFSSTRKARVWAKRYLSVAGPEMNLLPGSVINIDRS